MIKFLIVPAWLITLGITAQPTLASGLFTHPAKGYFSFQPMNQDPWYYTEGWMPPDKWTHFTGNYLGSRLLRDTLGPTKTILLLTALDIAKEVGDGYREGFSWRDMLCNTTGITAGLLDLPLVCTFDAEQKTVMLHCYQTF